LNSDKRLTGCSREDESGLGERETRGVLWAVCNLFWDELDIWKRGRVEVLAREARGIWKGKERKREEEEEEGGR
jgi:hypothetical protein